MKLRRSFKRFLAVLLVIMLVVSAAPVAIAATDEAYSAADALYALGLFKGTSEYPDGSPNL